jgi:16S rRNA processing protein RimM
MNDYVHIGKVVASFGLGGEVILQHNLGKKTFFKTGQAVFLEETKNSYIPWFVEQAKAKDDAEMYVKFEGLTTKESTRKIIQKKVWLTEADFRSMVSKSSSLALLGFSLIDDGNDLGPIEEVIEQPHQVLLRIVLNGNEALIPLHEETLDKIDHNKKQVHVTLPDGLLDVYR